MGSDGKKKEWVEVLSGIMMILRGKLAGKLFSLNIIRTRIHQIFKIRR